MVKLLIVADDFTGALDTGVQFATNGTLTRVVTDNKLKLSEIDDKVQVLVVDVETRHLDKHKAYEKVFRVIKEVAKYNIPYIYKKTDSGLRGNIGSELTAVIDATGRKILRFIPAYPKMRRITKNGIHYIDDIPVHKSVFGKDPFEPVIESYIPDIIRQQSDIKVNVVEGLVEDTNYSEPIILVYDAETDENLEEIASSLKEGDNLHISAGCAGFAEVFSEMFKYNSISRRRLEFEKEFLIVCGSVNEVTRKQLDFAERFGFKRIRIKAEQKLSDNYFDSEDGENTINNWFEICKENNLCIVDTNDLDGSNETLDYAYTKGMDIEQIRHTISTNLGVIVKKIFDKGIRKTILFTGGDTLLGFMREMNINTMTPICEMMPGTVLSEILVNGEKQLVMTKSGGFGEEDLFIKLADKILKEKWGNVEELQFKSTTLNL